MNSYNPKKIGKKLQRKIKGKVLWDKVSRYLYSTDASIYKLKPLIVVQPKSAEDVQEIVKFCNKYNISIHPRGAGTGLGGQALGEGVVIDFARFMRNVIEINPEKNYVWAEVGIKGAPLQKKLGEFNKYIPPDPSSQDYASLGGMIANNASGSHSVKYGDYDKWVEELEVILADGSLIRTKEYDLESEEFKELLNRETLESSIYKNLIELWKKNEETIKKAYPNVPHNATGYELRNLIKDGKINLTRLFVGSEGTFGIITKAKMRIKTKPKYKVLSTAYFDDLVKAGKAIKPILEQKPAAIELLGRRLLGMARERYPSLDQKLPKELDTMLLVEFEGDDLEECKKQAEATKIKITQEEKLAFNFLSADDPVEQANLWEARKSAVPLLYKIKGDRKIIAIIEDAVVPPEHLAKYVIDLENACKDLGVEFIAYGHAAKGLLHNRPLINMKDPEDIKKMQQLSDKSFELVKKLGGAISGEHSDGRLRAKYIKPLYGEEVFNIFKEVKRIFDPQILLNPDIKVMAKDNVQVSNLKFGEKYQPIAHNTILNLSSEQYQTIIETCIGCGKCGIDEPTLVMCPVYKGKPFEHALTRGKTNIVRGYIEGEFSLKELLENDVFEFIIYNCVNCQQCMYDCPSEVDAATLMTEMKLQYMEYHKPTLKKLFSTIKLNRTFHWTYQYLRNFSLAKIDLIGKLSSTFAPISNWITSFFLTRIGMHLTIGIDFRRKMPAFQRKTFLKWWKKHSKEYKGSEKEQKKMKVAYFYGCSANTITPEIGKATVELLEKMDIEVVVPPQKCCGSPAYSYGTKTVLDKNVKFNLDSLDKYLEEEGCDAIITSCTSCSLALKSEYKHITNDERAKKISTKTFLTTEFVNKLINEQSVDVEFEPLKQKVLYHTSCHLKAQREITSVSFDLLNKIPELEVEKGPNTCCGVSGSWGMKKENYDASMKIGRWLFDATEKEDIQFAVTDCPTCKMQIEHGTSKKVDHPVVLLNKSINVK